MSVRILDKEYQVTAPAEEIDELSASARLLDRQMSEIRDSGKVLGADRIAVMAGLNLSHELLRLRNQVSSDKDIKHRASDLTERITEALAAQQQLKL